MFRKSIFSGLMVLLGASLVWMIISGRRREKQQQQVPHPVEIIQNSKPTATRIYAPPDLQIISIRMIPAAPGSNTSASAEHSVEIRNAGSMTYGNTLLMVTYFGKNGKTVEKRDYQLKEPVPPGKTLTYQSIQISPLPNEAVKCSGRIIYADLEPASTK
jgi:hypothetical protein